MADGYELDEQDVVATSLSSDSTTMTAEDIYRELGCENLE